MFETALVSSCSAHENHEGGEDDIMILVAVQADLLSTTRQRQNSGRFGLLDFIFMCIFAFKSTKVEVWF